MGSTAVDPGAMATIHVESSAADLRCAEGQTSLRLEVPGTPASLMLAVQRGGAPLASKSLDLQYTAFYPNGRACGGACQEASVILVVAGAGSP